MTTLKEIKKYKQVILDNIGQIQNALGMLEHELLLVNPCKATLLNMNKNVLLAAIELNCKFSGEED